MKAIICPMLKVAIIGRPNVGKSSLFNRLVRRNMAIVHDTSGTTRDVREYTVENDFGPDFVLLDTAGIEDDFAHELDTKASRIALDAAKKADLVLFVLDARTGLMPGDTEIAREVRRLSIPVLPIANKAENKQISVAGMSELLKLGFGEPVAISASHNLGLRALKEAVGERLSALAPTEPEEKLTEEPQEEDYRVRIAIIGRPNAGKSTLTNKLLGEDRMLVSDVAGTTRDSIDVDFTYRGKDVTIIDTAGLRRKTRITAELEKLSAGRSIEAIKNADVCVMVVDATGTPDKQDMQIAEVALEEGKGVVFFVNKIDAAPDPKLAITKVKERLEIGLSQVKNLPVIKASAIKGKGIKELMDAVFELYGLRNMRVSTGRLNRWLEEAVAKNPPPNSRLKRPMKIKYVSQTGVRPPSFTLFVGGASDLPESYRRYLINSLGSAFGFDRIVIRLKLKSSKNPYDGKEQE